MAFITPSSGHTSTTTQTGYLSSGLTAGNTYTFYGWVMRGSAWYSVGSATVTMPQPPTPTANIVTVSSRFEGGFNLSWGSSSGASYYTPEYRVSGISIWFPLGTVYGTSYSFNGSFGTAYEFRNRFYGTNGVWSNYSSVTSATINPKTPTISGTVEGTTFTIYASIGSGNWTGITVERLTMSGSLVDSKTVTVNGGYAQWTGMSTGSAFQFRARSYYNIGTTLYSVGYSNTITLQNIKPTNFAWTASKVQGQPFLLYASEWNALTAKTNQFRTYKGELSISFIVAYQNNNVLASMFNQVRNAISTMSPVTSPPSVKSPNDPIRASDLNLLRDSLNSIP